MTSQSLEEIPVKTKKRKLQEHDKSRMKKVNVSVEETEAFESYFKLVPVLADDYFSSIETEKMFVGKISSKKETSRLIRELSAVWPLEGKNHLKRVRWTHQKDIFEILIRPLTANEVSNNTAPFLLTNVLGEANIDTTGLMDCVDVYEIPKHAALTQQQFKDTSEFWPTLFREDKNIEKSLKDELFSSEERKNISKFMQMCLTAAQHGDEKVGCIIVDPSESKVIAIAHDCRSRHPLQHAVMVAVDLVAKSQGGGCWDIDGSHTYHMPFSDTNNEGKIDKTNCLKHENDKKKMSLPYLCTSFDAYISREPCVMCAMALVHSRIKRVFYANTTSWGALGSHCKLHLLEGLNHHFEVWKVDGIAASEKSTEFGRCYAKS